MGRVQLIAPLCVAAFLPGCGGGPSASAPSSPGSPGSPPPAEVITITSNTEVPCIQSVPVSFTLQAQGNSGPLTWTIISGNLPDGLSLNSQTGTISGTPTVNSNNVANLQASDSKASASQYFHLPVYSKLSFTLSAPPNPHINVPYSYFLAPQTTNPIFNWTIVAGQLPPGMTFPVPCRLAWRWAHLQALSTERQLKAEPTTLK